MCAEVDFTFLSDHDFVKWTTNCTRLSDDNIIVMLLRISKCFISVHVLFRF